MNTMQLIAVQNLANLSYTDQIICLAQNTTDLNTAGHLTKYEGP